MCANEFVYTSCLRKIFIYRLLLLDGTIASPNAGVGEMVVGFAESLSEATPAHRIFFHWLVLWFQVLLCILLCIGVIFAKLWWQTHILRRHSYLYVSYCEHADFPCVVVWTPLPEDSDTWITFEAVGPSNF